MCKSGSIMRRRVESHPWGACRHIRHHDCRLAAVAVEVQVIGFHRDSRLHCRAVFTLFVTC